MPDEMVRMAEFERFARGIEARFERLDEAVSEGFHTTHAKQDLANGRVRKLEATCETRGKVCPAITIGPRQGGGGILLTAKQVVALLAGILLLALGAMYGPSLAAELLGKLL